MAFEPLHGPQFTLQLSNFLINTKCFSFLSISCTQEGSWHPDFKLEDVTLEALLEARAAEDLFGPAKGDTPQPMPKQASKGSAHQRGPPRPPAMSKKHAPCRDLTRMGSVAFLEHLKQLPWYDGQVRNGLGLGLWVCGISETPERYDRQLGKLLELGLGIGLEKRSTWNEFRVLHL